MDGDQKPNKINNNMPLSVSRIGFMMIEDMKQRYSRLTVDSGVHTSEVFHIGVPNCQKTHIDVYPASAGGIPGMCCVLLMALVLTSVLRCKWHSVRTF